LACFNRGCAYLCKGEYDRAIEDFTELIQVGAKGDYHLERGLAYLKKGACDPALADLTEAIRLIPLEGLPAQGHRLPRQGRA
jgi:tetratricopeptide (TPR) repeat protein